VSEDVRAEVARAIDDLATLHRNGVVLIPNVLDLSLGQVEVIAACWDFVRQWDVSLDRSRSFGDALDMLAFDGGEAPMKDAAWVLALLRSRGLIRTQEEAGP